MRNQKGQTVLILILVMTVALAIGISVIQRSLSDLSASSKVEQSSRAYSAAEAGIEKAILTNQNINIPVELGNNAKITEVTTDLLPDDNQALEYPPLAKEELAQVWLANPETLAKYYDQQEIDIYWGDPDVADSDTPAIEVTIIYETSAGEYQSKRYFLDRLANTRKNDFDSSVSCPSDAIQTSLSPTASKTFLCKENIDVSPTTLPNLSQLILLRARLLYNNTSQAFAVKPTAGSLPKQARLYTSTGESGNTQRK
ncbi:MAG: pilus assembly PilX N-terminal domain-containing protein, partial [Candidatus Daviesbacteria bacterium]|nr:pilus assembly PilX N-terminal domain-containing protein [Candidatus Daviesbacteria bacterium]